jgi:prolipoprotein diacylglyceryltransferase
MKRKWLGLAVGAVLAAAVALVRMAQGGAVSSDIRDFFFGLALGLAIGAVFAYVAEGRNAP